MSRVIESSMENVVQSLQQRFRDRARQADEESQFPHENFDALAAAGCHTLPLDEMYGGKNYGFSQIAELLIEFGKGCASTALCLAMHYYTIAGLSRIQNNSMLSSVFRDICEKGQFMSSFNQPNVMSQVNRCTPFDMVKIRIDKVNGGYVVNGRKNFVSGSERFKYLPVYGYQEGTLTKMEITALMVTRDDPGVIIQQAWNSTAMKASMSHHVKLDNVFVPHDRLIGREGCGVEDTQELTYWSRLSIPSVYQGISEAAIDYIAGVMKQKKDLYSQTLMANMPGPQLALADMKIKAETSRSQLLTFAALADRERPSGSFSGGLYEKSLVTKHYVTNTANEVVWLAMQIEGMNALNRGELLERLYRDVRAATLHQPMDDLLKELLAKKMLGVVTLRNRWA